ncbi:MAG: DNA cytosine methyltransferase, partial [Clostridium sp.]|nr:DNA cytosine methyltransferase [Clostridium sp.]
MKFRNKITGEVVEIKRHLVNSALVSAQNRQRYYWTNIPGVEQPEDKGIILIDILESGTTWLEKSYALTTRCSGAIISNTLKRHRHTMVAEPVRIGDIDSSFGKSVTINAGGGGQGGKTGLYIAPVFPFGVDDDDKAHCIDANYLKGSNPKQTLNKHRRTMVAELTDFNLDDYENVIIHDSGNIEIDGKLIYCIKDGYIWCKENKYEIDLPDGYYTIRKLTPIECERSQTLPDNYTEGISNAQRYKCIGNGWT